MYTHNDETLSKPEPEIVRPRHELLQIAGYEDIDIDELIKTAMENYDKLYNRLRAVNIKKFLKKHMKNKFSCTCLEVGCGGGYWTDFLSKQFQKLISVDIHENMINAARHYLRKGGNPQSNIEFLCIDVNDLSHEDYFDFIFFKDVV